MRHTHERQGMCHTHLCEMVIESRPERGEHGTSNGSVGIADADDEQLLEHVADHGSCVTARRHARLVVACLREQLRAGERRLDAYRHVVVVEVADERIAHKLSQHNARKVKLAQRVQRQSHLV
jgi:hypothetical protein